MSFSEAAYNSAAKKLGVEVRAIKAVAEVESSGTTQWKIAELPLPPVRLEAHWFGKLTGYAYNDTHPQISSRKWNPALAASTHQGAWEQFWEASSIDFDAAVQATSWGAFQVMGFHWKALGYGSPREMMGAADIGPDGEADGQLDMFVRFILATPAAHDALKRKDWEAFENHYNGGGYGGAYARKMRAAYERNSK